jgi:hypothetical protein
MLAGRAFYGLSLGAITFPVKHPSHLAMEVVIQ